MSAAPMSSRPTLAGRLILRYAITVVVVLAALAVVLDRVLADQLLDDLTASLTDEARAVRTALPPEDSMLQPAARSLGRELDVRVTVIRADGVVLADSTRDPATMENHAGRPEVRTALDGRVGVASRTSETTGQPYRYVALPPRPDRIVRLALPLGIVDARLDRLRSIVAGGAALAALLGVVAVWIVARGLTRPLRGMTDAVSRMSAGDLDARVERGHTRELDLLASTVNRLASELGARIEEVRTERRTLERILTAMEEGVMLIDPDESVGYANPAARRLLGPAMGTGLPGPPTLRLLLDRARTGRPAEDEVEIGVPPRTLRVTALPVGDQALLVLRDITEVRRVEAIRRDFVADASHELKTPVASIRATAETVRTAIPEDPEAAARFAERLHRESVRLSRIVSDLLDLSRLETESPRFEPVRVDRVVQEEVARLQDEADAAGIRVETVAAPAIVHGSPKDLGLLIRNLLDNAIRYTDRGGTVRVEAGSRDGAAVVRVSDTGTGIPTRDLPRIFERFYRVDRARSRETGGTGLGLSIARHVAEQHGGRIDARSELGRGSEFVVTLPLADAQGET
ncbi:MAG TPA: ATP-binding protein [Actinomycetota bacterium]|nr:ATP-binding protein [Actinomycetota bacterium]